MPTYDYICETCGHKGRGWLKARKRGTNRTSAQGGDSWYIKDKDIRGFIVDSIAVIGPEDEKKWRYK